MKKFFGLMLASLLVVLPFNVKAAIKITPKCGAADENGERTCTISYNITDDIMDSLVVTLTEEGGADIRDIFTFDEDAKWSATSREENGVWTITLTSTGVDGEGDLFSFSYIASGEKDCKVKVALGETVVDVVPETPDKPTDNKQTGATLPYIALGALVVLATGAYLATRNKAKMYKI